ncbi:MAG: UDP-2,3-diacylglucosamine diphosphatase [Gammaproteobacteria bacterium]|nr:UDP-2,3-diacylglucosamine diphosphatase [Gammaproteobacteria bacterium]
MGNDGHTLFIADLHLDASSRPDTCTLACRFFQEAAGADALYILGDFVEYWLGDDMGNPGLASVFDALEQLGTSGTALHLMHGNRDFLIGETFAEQVSATLHRDDVKAFNVASGESALLLHGDTLCTDDVDYQKLRRLLRSELWQQQFLSLSPEERLLEAKKLRDASKAALADKQTEIMDVNQQAVDALMQTHASHTLIHGHTHRPADHVWNSDDASYRRLVLGDWQADHAKFVRYDGLDFTLETFR